MPAIPAATLRHDALGLAFGILLIAVGVLAIGIRILRRRGEWSLLFFGIASALYGLRLLVLSDTVRGVYGVLLARHVEWTITFVIGIPFVLYFSSTLAPEWRKAIWITVAAQVALALFGIPATFTGIGLELAKKLNNILVVVFLPVLFLLLMIRPRKVDRDVVVLRWGALLLGIFSLYTNLVEMRIIPGSYRLEPIGFACFLGALGYVSVNRALRNEEQLVSIRSELEIARRIQTGLLPGEKFSAAQLEICSKYVPLSSVAGDFYDFLVGCDGMGVLIADVTGHGIPAALAASMVKVAIRSQSGHAAKPSQVLAGLNEILHGNLQGQFVTAAYVYFDPLGNKLAYSGAGHPPILVWHADTNSVEILESNGLFLGPFADVEYSTAETRFHPGDRCLLYTDGVTEVENPAGEDFGHDRLSTFLRDSASSLAAKVGDALLITLRNWSQRRPEDEQNDDITVVVVERKAG